MSVRMKAVLLCAGAATLLSACDKKAPAGQVVATVDGTEVTMQEVNAELAGANIPEGADKKNAQRAVLQRVLDRKLIAKEAEERGLNKTSEYIGQKIRMDETLLAQQYVKQQAASMAQPTAADIAKFMADNPNIFARREQLLVDQIRFQTPANPGVLRTLEPLKTQDAVAAQLAKLNIKSERTRSVVDTAVLPAPVVSKINALPAGEPFVLPARGILTINVIVGRRPAPIPQAQARQIAANGWREKQFSTMIQDKVKQLRSAAKITYQPGFDPPAQKGARGAKPAAGAAS